MVSNITPVVHIIHNQTEWPKKQFKVTEDKKDFYLALLDLRNTHNTKDSGSPVQRLIGRRARTLLPTTHQLLIPKNIEPKIVERKIQDQKDKQKFYYDTQTKQLPPLNVGDKVKH